MAGVAQLVREREPLCRVTQALVDDDHFQFVVVDAVAVAQLAVQDADAEAVRFLE